MLNIVIPMAGRGSRFSEAGFLDPKPMIPVRGVPMIKVVIDNLRPKEDHRFIFIVQKEHNKMYSLESNLNAWTKGKCLIVEIDGITSGAAATVLCAREYIDENPVMVANSDQYVDVDIQEYLDKMKFGDYDGMIMTMFAEDPKWSFVGRDEFGNVSRVVEKEVISNEATVGIYNFKNGTTLIKHIEKMIEANERVNGEFYLAPVYNLMISEGMNIETTNIGSEGSGMYGLGIPQDLKLFVESPVSSFIGN